MTSDVYTATSIIWLCERGRGKDGMGGQEEEGRSGWQGESEKGGEMRGERGRERARKVIEGREEIEEGNSRITSTFLH